MYFELCCVSCILVLFFLQPKHHLFVLSKARVGGGPHASVLAEIHGKGKGISLFEGLHTPRTLTAPFLPVGERISWKHGYPQRNAAGKWSRYDTLRHPLVSNDCDATCKVVGRKC